MKVLNSNKKKKNLKYSKENGINVVHIESHKSKRSVSEYEIFVSLECENESETMPHLVKSLKRQLSYIRIDNDYTNSEKLVDEVISNAVKITNENLLNEIEINRTSNKRKLKILV